MGSNGQHDADTHVLRWTNSVLAAEDVRTRLNGHRELVLPTRAIITPLAAEALRSRGVRVVRTEPAAKKTTTLPTWGYAQDRPNAQVQSAVQALGREGLALRELHAGDAGQDRWAKALAECVARGECRGGVLFCQDPGLICCVSNKIAGLRAVAVTSIAQAARATLTLGPNLVAVEMPGRTFFELRQILRMLCVDRSTGCPDGVACTLQELDGHAHR